MPGSPTSPSNMQHSSYADLALLVDIDFSDTSPAPTKSYGSPSSPFTPNNGWKLLYPDPPSAQGTPRTQTSPLQVEIDAAGEAAKAGGRKGGTEGEKEGGAAQTESTEPGEDNQTPIASPTMRTNATDTTPPDNDHPATRIENESESGESVESTSSNLRPVATPFTSRKITIVRSRTPPSFYSDRAERGSAVGASPLSSPTTTRRVRGLSPSPDTTRNHAFYGEGEGYTSHSSSLSPKTAMFALPEVKPIRISPPRKPVPALESAPPVINKNVTPISVPTPRRIPLPDSEPSSTQGKSASASESPLSTKTDASPPSNGVPPRNGAETPVSRLTRSMSEFSLGECESKPQTNKGTTTAKVVDSHSPTVPLPVECVEDKGEVEDAPSEPTSAGPQTPVSPQAELSSPAMSMPTRRTQRTIAGMMESLGEVDELESHWADYRDAYGKLSGGIEEVTARLRHNITGHSCSDNGHKDELQAARQENLLLQRRLQQMQDEMDKAKEKSAEALNFLDDQCTKITKGSNALKARALKAEAQEEAMRKMFDDMSERCVDKNENHWSKRGMMLAERYIELQTKLEAADMELTEVQDALAQQRKICDSEHGQKTSLFSAVLIECTTSMIDESFIKRGGVGGKELAQNILNATRSGGEDRLVVSQMFLNFPEIKKRLMLDYVIKKEADLHDFLDGFRSVSGLFTVVDTDSPADKIQDHFKLYKLLGAEKILIASRKPDTYRHLIEALPTSARDTIFAVRSHIGDDPFDFLGTGHLLHVPGLMQPTSERKSTAQGESTPVAARPTAPPSTSSISSKSERVTSPHLRPSSAASDRTEISQPRKPLRDRFTAPLISPPSAQTQRSLPEPPTPPPEIPPAPWAANTRNAQKDLRAAAPAARSAVNTSMDIPWWERGGTLNDEVQAARASSYASSVTSPPSTPRASSRGDHTPIASPTPRRPDPEQRRQSGRGLAIPVDDIKSLAGSPPDSDEDHPNVALPHSAVKRVQRPIEFSQPPSESGSGRSRSNSASSDHRGGQATAGNGYAGRAIAQQGLGLRIRGASGTGTGSGGNQQRAPSTTGTNSTPLGPVRNGGLGGTTGKLHGFTVQGWSTRQAR